MVEKQVTEMRRILKEDVPDWLLEINISYRDLIEDDFDDATIVTNKQQVALTQLMSLSRSLKKCTGVHRILIEDRYLRRLSIKTMMNRLMLRHSRYYEIENESLLELSRRYL